MKRIYIYNSYTSRIIYTFTVLNYLNNYFIKTTLSMVSKIAYMPLHFLILFVWIDRTEGLYNYSKIAVN